MIKSTELRFLARLMGLEYGDCWIWTGAISSEGYGNFVGANGVISAHRFAYELLRGPVAPGLHLDHLCRVRACCNPWHLEPVTIAENLRRGLNGVLREACEAGHPFNEINTRIRGNRRECRICDRLKKRQSRASSAG